MSGNIESVPDRRNVGAYDARMVSRIRRLHRILGLALVVPCLLWAATGLVFHIKPGYAGAYASLKPRTLPLGPEPLVTPQPGWLEVRHLRTSLGDHLLVRTADGWQHLDPATLQPAPPPPEERIRRLVEEAIAADPGRYGTVTGHDGEAFVTSTGVRITFDWDSLSLSQYGRDTAWIDRLYRIHYLQWTGIPWIDRPFALAGLVAIVGLAALGVVIAFR